MTPTEFRAALTELGLSQRYFADFTGCGERTVLRWSSRDGEVPPWVERMLHLIKIVQDYNRRRDAA